METERVQRIDHNCIEEVWQKKRYTLLDENDRFEKLI